MLADYGVSIQNSGVQAMGLGQRFGDALGDSQRHTEE
jgi:hypothetical protein